MATVERVDAVILWAADLQRTVAFYRAIGVPLLGEDHGDGGPVHHACDLGGVHLAIFAAGEVATAGRARGQAGCAQLSLRVDALDPIRATLVALGARVLIDRQDGPWGVRIVVEDPDGRPLQITAAA